MAKKPTVSAEERAVRDAAQALHEAITNARNAGFRVHWPPSADALPAIGVSETGRLDHARTMTVAEEKVPAVERALDEAGGGKK